MLYRQIGTHILSVSAVALLLGATTFAQTQQDQNFVKTAMEINLAEIQIGHLVLKQGASESVRKFGQRMITDHTRLENEITPSAAKIGITPPTELAPDDQALFTKLQGESGADFDATYVHAMAEGHRKAVQLYKTEETDAQDATVKSAATHGEPVIAEHLRLAEHLLSTMGKS
jgi:putative membrane protein